VTEFEHPRQAVWVWGRAAPAYSVGHAAPMGAWDSGFTVLFDDAPDPDEVEGPHARISIVCLHCLIDDHPELGRGLDIARDYGVADLDESGEWVVGSWGDLSGSN
jgi:hypothetical protein